jgi:hypothetical protein
VRREAGFDVAEGLDSVRCLVGRRRHHFGLRPNGSSSGGRFAGPGTGITGNDTGGIFPYTPDVEQAYEQIASDYCARWGRLSHVTSVHRKYGDYVSFVCIDKPYMIH